MRFAASHRLPVSLETRGNRTWQQSCSCYTAICSQRSNKRVDLRTHEQSPFAEQRRNRLRSERPQWHQPRARGTCHPRLQPLYVEKYKVSCSGFVLPSTVHMQHSHSQHHVFCSIMRLRRIFHFTWQPNMKTIMWPLHCDLQPEIQQVQRTTQARTTARCRTKRTNRRSERPQRHQLHTQGRYLPCPAAAILEEASRLAKKSAQKFNLCAWQRPN